MGLPHPLAPLLSIHVYIYNEGVPSEQAAERGEPSYVWRAGQDRRLALIRAALPPGFGPTSRILDDGSGLGLYVHKLLDLTAHSHGLEYERPRAVEGARKLGLRLLVNGASECLPYADASFEAVLSNEVIEHVRDDRAALAEIARVLRPGGRLLLFCPNRWYPVEQHGVYWRGHYVFGNIPLVNYLPDPLRNRLAPHVRTYTAHGLRQLLRGLPLRILTHTRIFGAYDNLIYRFGAPGRLLRSALQTAEATPLRVLGLSHWLVAEKLE